MSEQPLHHGYRFLLFLALTSTLAVMAVRCATGW